jgi:hypothetical protein
MNLTIFNYPLTFKDCKKTCEDLDVSDKNLVVINNFNVELAHCADIVEMNNQSNGPIWTGTERHGMVSCSQVETVGHEDKAKAAAGVQHIRLKDCYHGIVRKGLGGKYDIQQLLDIHEDEEQFPMDEADRVAPTLDNIIIFNETRLMVSDVNVDIVL